MMGRIAIACYRRRRIVVAIWVVVLVASILAAAGLSNRLGTQSTLAPGSDSARGATRLQQLGGEQFDIVGLLDGLDIATPGYPQQLAAGATALRALPGVRAVYDHAEVALPELVSVDGRGTLVVVDLDDHAPATERNHVVIAMRDEFGHIDGTRLTVGGPELVEGDFQKTAQSDLHRGEALTLPLVLVMLVVLIGGIIAAALPLVVSVAAVLGALAFVCLLSLVTDVSVFASNVATMLGLGLGIDYGLLMVARFREERANGLTPPAAIERAATACGSTVAFSGVTIAVALAGLLAFREPVLRSFAYGGIGTALVAVAAAVTLLPALLGFAGSRIRPSRNRLKSTEIGRLAQFVQRRAGLIVPVVALVLLALAVPFARTRLETYDARSLPRSSAVRQVADQVAARFPTGGTNPITLIAEAPPGSPPLALLQQQISAWPEVSAVLLRPSPTGDAAIIDIYPHGTSQGPVAVGLVHKLRGLDPPFATLVTGTAAVLVDYRASVASRLPLAGGIMMLAAFTLLFLLTGSFAVPLKALAVGLLSLGASFGALAWIFQDGHLSGVLGFDPVGSLDVSTPLLVFVFAFGLSMDYEVFMLARVKETWDEAGDNDLAVAVGLDRVGRVVTSAALLMVVVFAGFATGDLLTVKQLGLGMAIAVAIDATIIRCLLVPASMTLLGRANWWAPPPLPWLHSRLGIHHGERSPAVQPVPIRPVAPWPPPSPPTCSERPQSVRG
jgi:putative drug exporter of the RND superfamily